MPFVGKISMCSFGIVDIPAKLTPVPVMLTPLMSERINQELKERWVVNAMKSLQLNDNSKLQKIIEASGVPSSVKNDISLDKIQEIVFILKSLGDKFIQKFKFEYNSPYSLELQIEIDEILNQHQKIDSISINSSDKQNIITPFDELLKDLVMLDSTTLKLIATIFYLRNFNYSEDVIEKKLEVIAPYFKDNFKSALIKYQELKTVLI